MNERLILSLVLVFWVAVWRELNDVAKSARRVAAATEAAAASTTYALFDQEKPHPERAKRRNITPAEDAFMMKTTDCAEIGFVGYDNEVHPKYCRP